MNDRINGLARWLDTTRAHEFMQTVDWAVPTVQSIHILAIAAVFASSLVVSGRALGLIGSDWSLAQWGSRLNGWIGAGLAVLLVSGILMICGEPGRSLNNAFFKWKMLLLLVAITLFAALGRRMGRLNLATQPIPTDARILACGLVLVWFAMIVCGRWIAYT